MDKAGEKVEKKLRHYMGKALNDYKMIDHQDRLLVCLSGGKDSYTMTNILRQFQQESRIKFTMRIFTLDQCQPGWDDSGLRAWLERYKLDYDIFSEDTYSIVKDKVPEHKTYCSLCSRLRRGIIYRYARENGFNKIALGHHRDDLNTSLMMSIFFNGTVKSMPPKLRSDDGQNTIIRPLVYCQEADIISYAKAMEFPIIPCNLCGTQENLQRANISALLRDLAAKNPKIPSNMLHAQQSIQPSQLMDRTLWDFDAFELKTPEKQESDA